MLYYRYDAYEGDRVHMPIVVHCRLNPIPTYTACYLLGTINALSSLATAHFALVPIDFTSTFRLAFSLNFPFPSGQGTESTNMAEEVPKIVSALRLPVFQTCRHES